MGSLGLLGLLGLIPILPCCFITIFLFVSWRRSKARPKRSSDSFTPVLDRPDLDFEKLGPSGVSRLYKDAGYVPKYPVLLVPGAVSNALEVKESTLRPRWIGHRIWLCIPRMLRFGSLRFPYLNYLAKVEPKIATDYNIEEEERYGGHCGKHHCRHSGEDVNSLSEFWGSRILRNVWLQHICVNPLSFADPPGIKVRPTEGCVALMHLDRTPYVRHRTSLYADIVKGLVNIGYVEDKTVIAACLDFRVPYYMLEKRDQWFTQLKGQIEAAYETMQAPVVCVTHSMGIRVFQYFSFWIALNIPDGLQWLRKYIRSVWAIGGPFLGAPKGLRGALMGTSIGIEFMFRSSEMAVFWRSLGAYLNVTPYSHASLDLGMGYFRRESVCCFRADRLAISSTDTSNKCRYAYRFVISLVQLFRRKLSSASDWDPDKEADSHPQSFAAAEHATCPCSECITDGSAYYCPQPLEGHELIPQISTIRSIWSCPRAHHRPSRGGDSSSCNSSDDDDECPVSSRGIITTPFEQIFQIVASSGCRSQYDQMVICVYRRSSTRHPHHKKALKPRRFRLGPVKGHLHAASKVIDIASLIPNMKYCPVTGSPNSGGQNNVTDPIAYRIPLYRDARKYRSSRLSASLSPTGTLISPIQDATTQIGELTGTTYVYRSVDGPKTPRYSKVNNSAKPPPISPPRFPHLLPALKKPQVLFPHVGTDLPSTKLMRPNFSRAARLTLASFPSYGHRRLRRRTSPTRSLQVRPHLIHVKGTPLEREPLVYDPVTSVPAAITAIKHVALLKGLDNCYLSDPIMGMVMESIPMPVKDLYLIHGVNNATELCAFYRRNPCVDGKYEARIRLDHEADISPCNLPSGTVVRKGIAYETPDTVRQMPSGALERISGDGTVPYRSLSFPHWWPKFFRAASGREPITQTRKPIAHNVRQLTEKELQDENYRIALANDIYVADEGAAKATEHNTDVSGEEATCNAFNGDTRKVIQWDLPNVRSIEFQNAQHRYILNDGRHMAALLEHVTERPRFPTDPRL